MRLVHCLYSLARNLKFENVAECFLLSAILLVIVEVFSGLFLYVPEANFIIMYHPFQIERYRNEHFQIISNIFMAPRNVTLC